MPKPTTYQRPIPINRTNWGSARPGAPSGKPGRKAPKPAPETGRIDLQLELKLPKLKPPRT